MKPTVAVIDTGAFNRASLTSALEAAGARVFCSLATSEIARADAFVLPGVSNFGFIGKRLKDAGADGAIRAMIASGMPGLAICAGFQVLCRESEESPSVQGLGVLDAVVKRFDGAKRQHVGWTRVVPCEDDALLREGWAYFAHGFALNEIVPETIGRSMFDVPFSSAVRCGSVLGVQFHPERSGTYGRALISAFVDVARGADAG